MRRLFSQFEFRSLSLMVAAAILFASLSLGAGVVVVSTPNHSELTVNICKPLQVSVLTTSTLLARPAPAASRGFDLHELGSMVVTALARLSADASAPDTPPPKHLL